MITILARILKNGWLNFWRNKWLSGAAIGVMSLTIFVMISLLLINVMTQNLIKNLEDKIDISVYFKLEVPEEQILKTRAALVKLEEVRSVEYVSAEESLKRFKERHQDNPILMQSLEELGENPLSASLNVKAQLASQYESIVNFLNQSEYKQIIDKINYRENERVIARLSSITNTIRKTGFIVSIILALIAILVTFNTVRLTIYSVRGEINVMKLVGASNWFIRGPFVVEGALYGFLAALITLLVFYPLLWYLSPKITGFLPGSDLFYFFQMNFWSIVLLQIAIGVGLGVISSLVAIRRYLRVEK